MYFLNGECISDEKVKKIILSISWQLKFFNPQSDEFLSWVGSLEPPPFPGIQWMQKERKNFRRRMLRILEKVESCSVDELTIPHIGL